LDRPELTTSFRKLPLRTPLIRCLGQREGGQPTLAEQKLAPGASTAESRAVEPHANATTSVSNAIEAGADFALAKPVQDKQLRNLLDIAIPRMNREHRRY